MPGHRLFDSLRRFRSASQANVAVTFALSLIPFAGAVGAAGGGVDCAQQLVCWRATGLGQRDRARQGAPVAGEQRVCQFHFHNLYHC